MKSNRWHFILRMMKQYSMNGYIFLSLLIERYPHILWYQILSANATFLQRHIATADPFRAMGRKQRRDIRNSS